MEFSLGIRRFGDHGKRTLQNAVASIAYTAWCVPSRKWRVLMDVDGLVQKWKTTVVVLASAHDRDEYDQAEATIDNLLTPILSAPVKQVREFWSKLVAELKSDKQVPMIVWQMFDAWENVFVKNAPDQGVIRLKVRLARDIAEMVEEDVKPQLMEAMVRALRWRSPEQLQAVKEKLKTGVKPKVRGRESCLFLEVGTGKQKATVML